MKNLEINYDLEELLAILQQVYQAGYDSAIGMTGRSPSKEEMDQDIERILFVGDAPS